MESIPMIERSFANLTLETKENAPAGTFEGYGAVFGNTDRDGDIVAFGAFADSLKGRLPALLWQHNPKEPIGRFDVVREDKKGLYVKGRLSQTGRGAEAYELMKMGALDGLSIGFVTREAARNAATGTRTINKADLMEVSLVTFPANELARVASVKQRSPEPRSPLMYDAKANADIEDPRTFERFLRQNGFSRTRAKAITAKGFRGLGTDTLDIKEATEVIELLRARKNVLNSVCNAGHHGVCNECAPCRKAANNDARCEALRNDIIDGNISRWKAWRELDRALKRLSSGAQKYAEKKERERRAVFQQGLEATSSSILAAKEIMTAVAIRWTIPKAVFETAEAVFNIVKLVNDIYNYIDNDFKKFIRPYVRAVDKAKDNAEYLDQIFWQQVRAHEREGCSTLPSSAFNQPSNLRF
jgi:HK97 family phage prohead protease